MRSRRRRSKRRRRTMSRTMRRRMKMKMISVRMGRKMIPWRKYPGHTNWIVVIVACGNGELLGRHGGVMVVSW